MSTSNVAKQYARLLARWPSDRLRPEQASFQTLLRSRIAATRDGTSLGRDDTREINSAYLLLDNALAKQYPLSERLMKPDSAPEHYVRLKAELEEVPDRTWASNVWKRMKNMVRLQ